METFTAEVWTSDDATLLAGFSGPNALCDAVAFTDDPEGAEHNIYYLSGETWLQWVGPRPANPPGR